MIGKDSNSIGLQENRSSVSRRSISFSGQRGFHGLALAFHVGCWQAERAREQFHHARYDLDPIESSKK
jgi:hypothetical protein